MRCRLHVCGCFRCRTFADLLTWPCCSIVNRLPKSAMVVVVIAPFRDVIITCWTSSCKWNRLDVNHLIIIRNSRVSLTSVLSESSIYFLWIWSTRHFQSWSRTKPWIVCPVTVPSSHFSSLWKFWKRTCSPIVNSRSFLPSFILDYCLLCLSRTFPPRLGRIRPKLALNRR